MKNNYSAEGKVFIGKSEILTEANAFNRLQYAIWIEVHEDNLASYRYGVGKAKVFS